LPTIGRDGLVVITRDKRIRYRRVEKDRWVEYGVRGFVLTGKRSQSTSDSKAILERWWVAIEGIVERRPTGPWMYAVTNDRVREIDL
jgi:isopentenyldiphosphate isomerase